MNSAARRFRRAVASTVVVGGVLVLGDEARPSIDSIAVTAQGFRDDGGQAGCAVFSSGQGFPKDIAKAFVRRFVRIDRRSASCTFDSLRPGVYAVVVFHDSNSNGVVDTNFLGIPTEGIGVSRDARGSFGPPSFADAEFRYDGGVVRIPVSVHYL